MEKHISICSGYPLAVSWPTSGFCTFSAFSLPAALSPPENNVCLLRGRPWQDPPSFGHGFSPRRLPPPPRRHASLRLTTASNSLKALGFFPLRSEASSSVAWSCLATPLASSEGPPKLDLTAQGISLYSCLNLNNLVLNNNTMVIACMGPKLHLNNVQELTQTNRGQKMHFRGRL